MERMTFSSFILNEMSSFAQRNSSLSLDCDTLMVLPQSQWLAVSALAASPAFAQWFELPDRDRSRDIRKIPESPGCLTNIALDAVRLRDDSIGKLFKFWQ